MRIDEDLYSQVQLLDKHLAKLRTSLESQEALILQLRSEIMKLRSQLKSRLAKAV